MEQIAEDRVCKLRPALIRTQTQGSLLIFPAQYQQIYVLTAFRMVLAVLSSGGDLTSHPSCITRNEDGDDADGDGEAIGDEGEAGVSGDSGGDTLFSLRPAGSGP